MKNAFGSVEFGVIRNVYAFLLQPDDTALFEQRFRCASTLVPALECDARSGVASVCLRPFSKGSGPLPGDGIASDIFRDVFNQFLRAWIARTKTSMLTAVCPITSTPTDIGKSVFADDLCDKKVYASPLSRV